MRFVSYISIFLLLIACTSVSQQKKNLYSVFLEEKNLSARTVLLDTALFVYPFRIRIQDSVAIMHDLHGIDHYFQVFNYPEGRYLASFGRRGESPSEMLSAENVRFRGNALWTLDANKGELVRFEYSLLGDSLIRQEEVTLDEKLLRVLDFVQYSDSSFIIPDYSGDNRFCIVNNKGKLIHKFGTIPSLKEDVLSDVRPALAQAWRSFIDYNPHNSVLAAVTQLGEVLEIYNLKDSTHVVRIGPHGEPEFQIMEGHSIPTGIMGFSDVQVTDHAIYAVFHGRSFKDIAQDARKGNDIDGGQYIYVFSLKGEPLRKYVLDHFIYGISVDEEKNIILATDVNKDEPLLEYRLN